jgi:hypothetical protein
VTTTNIVAQYLTVGGATVEIQAVDSPDIVYTAACTGCAEKQPFTSGDARYGTNGEYAVRQVIAEARAWAQPHASVCRALPNPNGAQQ